MTVLRRLVPSLALGTLVLSACGGSSPAKPSAGPPSSSKATAADAIFVRHMLPHHQRALQVGTLAAQKGSDPRVRMFGQRIVAEQTPEEQRLAGWVPSLRLIRQPGDAMMADGYITGGELARLQAESGATFDHDFLVLSARSESGAATMAQAELAGGTYPPARNLATSIAGAPHSEIPELQALAARIPG